MAGALEAGASKGKTIQAALENMGMEGTASEVAGTVGDLYEAGEKYGGAFWDAVGGDFSALENIGMNFAGMYAINATFGEGFAGNTPQQAFGAQAGQAVGAIGGPFGMIAGGMFGAIAGAAIGKLLGMDTAPDYDFVMRTDDKGFEDNKYITTPFGNFGFNASSTRDMSMSKQGSQMLDMYGRIILPMDVAMASTMTEDEVNSVKEYMNNDLHENSHLHKPEQMARLLVKQRLDAINSTMSDQRKADTGFHEMIANWNEGLADGYDEESFMSDPKYQSMTTLFSKSGEISQVSYDNDDGRYGAQEGDFVVKNYDDMTGRTSVYNISQAIRDGEFSPFESRVMASTLESYYAAEQAWDTGPRPNLMRTLNESMENSIRGEKAYAIG